MVTKKTQRLKDDTIEKIVNVRAMHKLEKAVKAKVPRKNLPKLDDVLNEFVNEVMEKIGTSGDDVGNAEDNEDESSDDDEQYELLNEDTEEEDCQMDVNSGLLQSFTF